MVMKCGSGDISRSFPACVSREWLLSERREGSAEKADREPTPNRCGKERTGAQERATFCRYRVSGGPISGMQVKQRSPLSSGRNFVSSRVDRDNDDKSKKKKADLGSASHVFGFDVRLMPSPAPGCPASPAPSRARWRRSLPWKSCRRPHRPGWLSAPRSRGS